MSKTISEHPQLKKTLLQEVVFDIRFQQKEDFSLIVGTLYDSLKTDYPIFKNLNVPDFPAEIPGFGEVVRYRVYSQDEKSLYNLGKGLLSINTLDYKGFTQFISAVEKVMGTYYKIGTVLKIKRLGLRYINNIELDKDLSDMVTLSFNLPKGISETQIGYRLMSTCSLPEGILTTQLAKEAEKDSVLLDFDLYKEGSMDMSLVDIYRWVDSAHQRIYSIFKESLTKKYFKELSK